MLRSRYVYLVLLFSDGLSTDAPSGRSGTGKTTTMIFKMLANERTWVDLYQGTMGKPRQLFMTQSHVLAQKVEEYFARLMQGFATENLSMSELKKMATASPLKRQAARMRMVNADEVARWNATGPTRYGDLKDSDFPMFLTFDRVSYIQWLTVIGAQFSVTALPSVGGRIPPPD